MESLKLQVFDWFRHIVCGVTVAIFLLFLITNIIEINSSIEELLILLIGFMLGILCKIKLEKYLILKLKEMEKED